MHLAVVLAWYPIIAYAVSNLVRAWTARGTQWHVLARRVMQELNPFMLPLLCLVTWQDWLRGDTGERVMTLYVFCTWGWRVLRNDDDDDDPWRRRGRRVRGWLRRAARRAAPVSGLTGA